MPPQVRVCADGAALATTAADAVVAIAAAAVARRGVCHVALSGGSTPARLYAELVARGRGAAPWDRIELWWGDERCVAPDHPDSNYGAARARLIAPLGLDPARVHRIAGEAAPAAAADAYARALVAALGAPPRLDLVLLGLGVDGHTASLFPGSPALAARDRWVAANPVTSPLVAGGQGVRITVTYPTLAAARHVRFLVAGADKAAAVAAVVAGADLPAGRVAPTAGDVVWLVDAAAAARLDPEARGAPS